MPINPTELLTVARNLVDRNPGTQIESDLRRAITTAYYAVFHLLITAAMNNIVKDVAFRPRLGRIFQHGQMKNFCTEYLARKNTDKGTAELRQIAEALKQLQEARLKAEYDGTTNVIHVDAEALVEQAEAAFSVWLTAEVQPTATYFLQDLLISCVPKR